MRFECSLSLSILGPRSPPTLQLQLQSVRVSLNSLPPWPICLILASLPSLPFTASALLPTPLSTTMAKTRSKRGKGSSKRRRRSSSTALKRSLSKTAAASAGAAIHTSHPTHPGSTLENFALLPYEIKTHVLELACSPPLLSSTSPEPESDADAADRSRSPQLDYVTTLNLTLVSTIFYRLVAPILFHSVCISRPSALAAFGLALQNHPQLGSLVRHLHVGPMDELPGSYAALEEREGYACSQCSDLSDGYHHPCTLISHSLQRSEETSLLPRWCTPNRQWDLDYPPSVSASSESVYQALREAQRAIDVDLVKGTRHGGQALASRFDWMERIWEVQAALDLCLMMMRRWEEDHATSHISVLPCDRRDYPPLVLLGYSMAPPSKDKAWTAVEPYVVTRSQLLRHLARRGSVTDRFDHPLLFARSGLDLELIEAGQEVERKHNVPEGAAAGTWASYLFSPPDSPPDYLLPSTATLGSLLSLLHSSLSRLHGLENLALSGFLELAICRAHPTPLALPSVRSLSIGPPAPHGFGRVRLDKMRGLQHLRLCGIRIPEHGWLDGVVRKLQSLQHVQTTPGMQVPSEGLQK